MLPEDSLPSHPLDEVSYSNYHKERSEEEHKGLQPDLDPKVREVLEALDDDAYAVSDGEGTDGEDEFWNGVLKGGERNEYDDYEDDYEDEEQDHVGDAQQGIEKLKLANGTEIESHVGAGEWDAVKRFKQQQQQVGSDDEEDYGSEMGDTIAELVKSNARRPKRGAGTVAGSSFSMSSSAMFRNEGLRTLDDRFDQVRPPRFAGCVAGIDPELAATDRKNVRGIGRRFLGWRRFGRRRSIRGRRVSRTATRGSRSDHGRFLVSLRGDWRQDASTVETAIKRGTCRFGR